MSRKDDATATQWESFEQWKEDMFPTSTRPNGETPSDFNTLVEEMASRYLAEAKCELQK